MAGQLVGEFSRLETTACQQATDGIEDVQFRRFDHCAGNLFEA